MFHLIKKIKNGDIYKYKEFYTKNINTRLIFRILFWLLDLKVP